MKANVRWVGAERFVATSESNHAIVLDADGAKTGPSPLENVLLSLGSCSSVDVVTILQKAKQQISGCEVDISAERVDTIPRVFSKIHLHFIITGHAIKENHVARAVSLSADKYCSVAKMLEASVAITHDFEIIAV